MKKPPSSTWRKVVPWLLTIVAIVAGAITWPWWYPWLLWRQHNTSWALPGPGVDPRSLKITEPAVADIDRIPRIIHQTWKDENVPPEWLAAQQSCRDMHPGYEYRLWTDKSSREFIAAEFPELLKTWDDYTFNIQRADMIRYAILSKFGGYYIDLDIVCLRPLDFLGHYPFVIPKTWPVGFSNDFMASEPNNPFLKSLVASIPSWNMNLVLKYPTVMFSTGPMLVTLKASLFGNRADLFVLTDDMYNKYVKGELPLFRHLHGSTWHGEDAKSVLWILHHPIFLAVLTLTVLVAAGALSWGRFQRKRSKRLVKDGAKNSEMTSLEQITVVKSS